MNERIKELAKKTTKHYPATESSGEFSTFDKEKFAELIVRECAKICADTAVTNPPNDLLYGYNLGVNKATENIMTHFGVE